VADRKNGLVFTPPPMIPVGVGHLLMNYNFYVLEVMVSWDYRESSDQP
jgi:hypothetical protein